MFCRINNPLWNGDSNGIIDPAKQSCGKQHSLFSVNFKIIFLLSCFIHYTNSVYSIEYIVELKCDDININSLCLGEYQLVVVVL